MNKNKRTEKDLAGTMEINPDVLYGIHSMRACRNFPNEMKFHPEWYMAVGSVKQACYQTYMEFKKAVKGKYGEKDLPVRLIDDAILEQMLKTTVEISQGKYFEHFIVPGISGGAGTSINMNVNEIIANASLVRMGEVPGNYNKIDPVEHANIFQSTNDVIPTSLKVAVIRLLNELEAAINQLRSKVELLEQECRNELRIAYTQMQAAVPSSYGRLFSTYGEALSRDWWRVSKCFERIKVVNLGGSATGTGLTVPRFFLMEVVQILQKITGLPVTRAENLSDATCNMDAFVEVHAILKAHAVNLEKIVSDIRLLASDIAKSHEIKIPEKQTGSSIMPGKVNPVIPEYVISVANKVYANDSLISALCGQGCLDLNAYLPVIGHALIESLKLLTGACKTMKDNLLTGMFVIKGSGIEQVLKNPSITAALLPYIGYHRATSLAVEMKEKGVDIFKANENLGLLDNDKLSAILEPQNLLKEGYSLKDVME